MGNKYTWDFLFSDLIYYKQSKDDEGNLVAEILFNDDYEVWVTVYKGNDFECFSNLNDFMISADEPRKINSINANHYLDKELSRNYIWSELNNDKLYNLNFINQMYKDELDIKSENQESNRTSNMSSLQLYNDNYLSSNQQENTSDINSDYVNSQNLNRLKEVTGKFSSSNNISKLAQQFPEGITEKIYERKNLNGDVLELTIVRIVVAGNNASEYKKIKSKTAVNYFKNGGIISHNIWDTETN